MTAEELERIKRYADLINAADGDLDCLTVEEIRDLMNLLVKWLLETEAEPPIG